MKIAIITGASSGLGEEFTKTIAQKYGELDELWVIARRKDRLERLAAELLPTKVRPIPMDLTDREEYAALSALLEQEKPDVRLLVNNAGYCECGRFDGMDVTKIETMIDLNITALTLINRLCFPYMPSGTSVILTCSVSSFSPVIGQAVYSASKVYVRYLGRALHAEMKKKGVNVLTLCPGNMDTEMNVRGGGEKEKAGSLPYLDLKKITATSLARAEHGKGFYTPGWF